MQLDFGKVRKPIRALRKSLNNCRSNPPVKAVHDLRTSSRKLEAMVVALSPDDGKRARQFLKAVKPLRKAAGQVRDMDVLTAKAITLVGSCRSDSVARLLEHLRIMRAENAKRLLEAIAARRTRTYRGLDRLLNQLQKKRQDSNNHADQVRQLISELVHWPIFDSKNLHEFRIKVKQLRYTLQLAEGTSPEFLKVLDNVKTRIGTWHDWHQLATIAKEVLNRQRDSTALAKIQEIDNEKFDRALKAAQAIKTRYLGGQSSLINIEP